METITFYSYKGGVGRTLALANVSQYLALLGQNVVALDFDLEAPGLHYKLTNDNGTETARVGIVDYIIDRLNGEQKSIKSYIEKIDTARVTGSINMIRAGSAPSPEYWQKLGKIDWSSMLYAEGSPGMLIFLELKELIRQELKPDFLLIDARTGITEAGGVATTLLADKVVCLLSNSAESIDGSRELLRALLSAGRAPGLAPLQIFPVLSRLPARNPFEERVIIEAVRERLAEGGRLASWEAELGEILVLHNEPSLLEGERLLIGQDEDGRIPLLQDYLRLFARLSADVVLKQTGPIIERAMDNLLFSPDDAQRELESLVESFDIPNALRQLVRVYRLRNVAGERILSMAERLWQHQDPSDHELIADVVTHNFKEVGPWDKSKLSLNFVEDVWWQAANGPQLAVALARSLHNRKEPARALKILRTAWERHPDNDSVLGAFLNQLAATNEQATALHIIDNNKARILSSKPLTTIWARLVADASSEVSVPEDLLSETVREILIESNSAAVYSRLLIRSGLVSDASREAVKALTRSLRERDYSGIEEAARILLEAGDEHFIREIVASEVRQPFVDQISDAIEKLRVYSLDFDIWDRALRRR